LGGASSTFAAEMEASALTAASLIGSAFVSSTGAAGSAGVGSVRIGVSGGEFFSSFSRRASRFFSSVRRKTLIVVRRDLFGLQSAAATGVCSQTGQEEGRVDWPFLVVREGRVQDAASTHKSRISLARSMGVGTR